MASGPARTSTGHITRMNENRIKMAQMGHKPLISIEMQDKIAQVGHKPLISCEIQEVIVDVLVRLDRANEGVGIKQAVDIVGEMCPELSSKQITNALFKLRKTNLNFRRLTRKPVAAQATTTKRTGITPESQFRWHTVCTHTIFRNIFSRPLEIIMALI